MQVKGTQIKLMDGMINNAVTLTVGDYFAKNSWVYLYAFSDSDNSNMGFGVYAPSQATKHVFH